MTAERNGGWLARWAAILLWLALSPALASEPLTLVLNWVPGADHAPFFYALRQGWYAAAGIALSVDSVAGSPEAIKRAAQTPGTLAVADFVSYLRARTSFPGAHRGDGPAAAFALRRLLLRCLGDRAGTGPRRQTHRCPAAGSDAPPVAPAGATQRDRHRRRHLGRSLQRGKAGRPPAGEADAAFNPFLHNHLNYVAVLGPDMRVLWWHDLGFAGVRSSAGRAC